MVTEPLDSKLQAWPLGIAVETPLCYPHHVSEYQHSRSGSTAADPRTPQKSAGDAQMPGSPPPKWAILMACLALWFWLGPVLAMAGIWQVNQWVGDLSLSPSSLLSLLYHSVFSIHFKMHSEILRNKFRSVFHARCRHDTLLQPRSAERRAALLHGSCHRAPRSLSLPPQRCVKGTSYSHLPVAQRRFFVAFLFNTGAPCGSHIPAGFFQTF